MTKQTLERLIEMQKAIAICECIINDIVEGYKLQLATPRTEEEVPDCDEGYSNFEWRGAPEEKTNSGLLEE